MWKFYLRINVSIFYKLLHSMYITCCHGTQDRMVPLATTDHHGISVVMSVMNGMMSFLSMMKVFPLNARLSITISVWCDFFVIFAVFTVIANVLFHLLKKVLIIHALPSWYWWIKNNRGIAVTSIISLKWSFPLEDYLWYGNIFCRYCDKKGLFAKIFNFVTDFTWNLYLITQFWFMFSL